MEINRKSGLASFRQLSAILFFCAFFFFAAQAQAQLPALTRHVPKEVSSGAAPLVGHLSGEQRVSLAISLPLRNEAELDALLQQLYDPQSPNYHKYLSVQEFTERFAPAETDHAEVLSFASSHRLDVIDRAGNRMVVDVEGPASTIESVFHVSLGLYQHPTESRTFYAPDREPTPDLNVQLLHISGMDNFSLPQAKNVVSSKSPKEATGSGPGGSFLGSDLRAAYYGSGPLDGAGQSVALFEFNGYEPSDVHAYFNTIHQTYTTTIKNVAINGAKLACPPQNCNDSEPALDIEQVLSTAPGLTQLVVYVGKSDASIFSQMAADNTSKTISCSWGWADNESVLDPIFKEMAAQGQTVFVATGDQGANTPGSMTWPSDDPWVTAVGGTALSTTGAGGAWASETGWQESAGMPSKNNVPIPSYQQLAGVIKGSNHGSTTLRNIPDVAAESNANQYVCYQGVCRDHGGGTSYAAPLWATFTAMVNQQLAANGKPAIGFLNPALYAIGTGASFDSDFHDIVQGYNGKYSAVTGYDLVTGWGSPDGVNLINALAPPQ